MSKIVDFTYLSTFSPGGSSGTGYSEPDFYDVEIELSDGIRITRKVSIDLWYVPSDLVYEQYREGINPLIRKYEITNYDDAFSLFFKEAVSKCGYHYKWEEVKKGQENYLKRNRRASI